MTEKDGLKDVQEHEEYLEAKDGTQIFMRSWLPQQEIKHVVFAAHGGSSHSGTYRRFALALCERNIATFGIDLRGFGHSGTPGDAEDFAVVYEDIAMALSAIRARYPDLPVSMLGWSMGVATVINALDQYELNPSTVILIAGRVGGTVSARQMLKSMAFLVKSFFLRNTKLDTVSMMKKEELELEIYQLLLKDELCTKRFSRRYILGQIPFMNVKRLIGAVTKISVPTLIIHGERDRANPADDSRQLYENLTVPQKKLVIIPDMDHDLFGLGNYMGPGLHKPFAPDASRFVEEIVAWLRADHA